MQPSEAAVLDGALWRARQSAFSTGEFVGQESFVTASEIRSLARCAGIAPGTSILDLCCGTAGPGLVITQELGCTYLGVDSDPSAVAVARERAAGVGAASARFEVATVPPVPAGPFDVVVLLETLLAFRDKRRLLREVASALAVGGRFAFTVEEGAPLTDAERARMPNGDTVWLVRLPELLTGLEDAGLRVRWQADWSDPHLATVDALTDAYTAAADDVRAAGGAGLVEGLVAGHRLWSEWLRAGRVRKLAVVAERIRAT